MIFSVYAYLCIQIMFIGPTSKSVWSPEDFQKKVSSVKSTGKNKFFMYVYMRISWYLWICIHVYALIYIYAYIYVIKIN
jgi:hypothetical protein